MSYKTILVHLNRASRCAALLETATTIAQRQQGHVTGLYVRPHIQAALAVDSLGNTQILDDEIEAERRNAEAIEATFTRMTEGQAFTAEWRAMDAMRPDFAANVVEQAITADLFVAAQSDPDWPVSSQLDFTERLILESGRPVLLVPYVGNYREIGTNVVIAWKPLRESARAVFNALPLLKTAKTVHILQIGEGRRSVVTPDTELAATLARHGVKAQLTMSQATDHSVGSELLSRLSDLGTDLLVMGAYGHTRLREYVFGGATRDITRTMTVPTLFSH